MSSRPLTHRLAFTQRYACKKRYTLGQPKTLGGGHRKRTLLCCTGLTAVICALLVAHIFAGAVPLSLSEFFALLVGEQIPGISFIVMEDQLPRALLGLAVGAAFGVAGIVLQTLLHNPLASPDVVGISGGASIGALSAITLIGSGSLTASAAAFLGALTAAAVIVSLARHRGAHNASPSIILMGLGVAAITQALIIFLLQRADTFRAQEAFVWLIGSLNSVNWGRLGAVFLGLAAVAVPLAVLRPSLKMLQTGDELAASTGVAVKRDRLGLLLLAVICVSVATAGAGPIAFVAFMAGPLSRGLMGGEVSLLAAALTGSAIVLAADYVAAYVLPAVLPTGAFPVGVITGATGAFFLLWLVATQSRTIGMRGSI